MMRAMIRFLKTYLIGYRDKKGDLVPLGVGNKLFKVEFTKLLNRFKSKSPFIDSLAIFAEFRVVKASFIYLFVQVLRPYAAG